jgi:hypothetical protein
MKKNQSPWMTVFLMVLLLAGVATAGALRSGIVGDSITWSNDSAHVSLIIDYCLPNDATWLFYYSQMSWYDKDIPLPLHAPRQGGYKEYPCDCGGGRGKAEVDEAYISAESHAHRTEACWEAGKCESRVMASAHWRGSFLNPEAPLMFVFDLEGFGFDDPYFSKYDKQYYIYLYTSLFRQGNPWSIFISKTDQFPLRKNNWVWIPTYTNPLGPENPFYFNLQEEIVNLEADNQCCPYEGYTTDHRLGLSIRTRVLSQNGCTDLETPSGCNSDSIIKLCHSSGGARVKLSKRQGEEDIFIGYIAGCYYPKAENDWHVLKDGKRFRWVNIKLDASNKPVLAYLYTYDCEDNKVEKRRYNSMQEFYDNINPYELEGEPQGGQVWSGTPPQDSGALNNVPLTPGTRYPAGKEGRRIATPDAVEAEEPMSIKTMSPGCSVLCGQVDGNTWYYSLAGSSALGAIICPGDTLTFQGPGIQGGMVTGNAAAAAYGAWKLKEWSPGRVVFEATQGVKFTGSASGFVLYGETGTMKGEVKFSAWGNWLGVTDTVTGPVFAPNRGMPWLPLLLID